MLVLKLGFQFLACNESYSLENFSNNYYVPQYHSYIFPLIVFPVYNSVFLDIYSNSYHPLFLIFWVFWIEGTVIPIFEASLLDIRVTFNMKNHKPTTTYLK